MNSNSGLALSIVQNYPADRFNLLVPMATVTEIAEIQKPVMNVVQISTNPVDKEIYLQEKGYDGKPDGYALTKKGLMRLMRAAGIKIIETRAVIPSTCQKCVEVNRNIGGPVSCGNCDNKDVRYEAKISVPQLTGENVEFVAHKEIIVKDVTSGMKPKQMSEFLKFRAEMCETKAINRALRMAMHIKGTYTLQELEKPFVVAYLVPNLDHEAVRAEAVKHFFSASQDLFGTSQQPRVEQHETAADIQPQMFEATPPPLATLPDQQSYVYGEPEPIQQYQQYEQPQQYLPPEPHPTQQQYATQQQQYQYQQRQSPPQSTQNAAQGAPPQGGQLTNVCADCGSQVTQGVIRWSQGKYGRTLCMNCQKRYGG